MSYYQTTTNSHHSGIIISGTSLSGYSNDYDSIGILYKNFFNQAKPFESIYDSKIGYPVDIYESQNGLNFEIATPGLSREDIEIITKGDIIKISYDKKENSSENINYVYRGISKKSFNFGYRIPILKYKLDSIEAEMDKGLLKITIPFTDDEKPKSISIK